MQPPSIGQTVLYCFRDRGRIPYSLIERPAIITSIDEGQSTVNLTVFFEMGDADVCSRGISGVNSTDRYESVERSEDDTMRDNTWRPRPA